MTESHRLPESIHFHLEPLTNGVYAALAKDGGLAIANAGIIDLGDRTLVFDTFASTQAAEDLVRAAERVTGRSIALAVNSHWHADHVLGNQALPAETTILSTAQTRRIITRRIPDSIVERQRSVPAELQQMETRLQSPLDTQERLAVGSAIDFYRQLLAELPTLTARPPDVTFERRLVLHGSARQAELLTFGGGHTASDTILYLPDDQIAFVADLLFNQIHPWLGDGDPHEWLRMLDEIDALDPPGEVIVPGHGAVGTPAAFGLMRRYIRALDDLVRAAQSSGATAEDLAGKPVPAAFAAWGGGDHFAANVRFLFAQHTEQHTDS